MDITPAKKRFQTVNLLTVILLFVLIAAGAVVRTTGSGMGCPDWPKCFGRYVPPTSVDEIPAGYKDTYVKKREAKNIRFAHTLDVFGFNDLAKRIRNDRSILLPEEFNVAKTWTEYINRLIGVLSGLFLLLTAALSFAYWPIKKRIVLVSLLNLVLVGFQGWLGGIVVSTNLVAWIVTVHMLLALAIVALSIYTYHQARITDNGATVTTKPFLLLIAVLALIISIIQITFGTEVREKIDSVAAQLQGRVRSAWVNDAGQIFFNHRDMAILVLVVNVVLYALIRKAFSRHSLQQQLMSFTFLMIMLQIVTGIILSYHDLPPAAQAIHLVLASLVFGAQFYLLLNLTETTKSWGSNG
jgi:cytochrome c oxidase assembly protein subunit 15